MKNRETLINTILVLIIVGLGVLVATSRYQQPRAPEFTAVTTTTDTETEEIIPDTETPYKEEVAKNIFPKLGEQRIFKTLIPAPTPRPRPTPTPKPDPKLAVLIRHWKLNGVMGKKAIITDRARKEEFYLEEGESKTVSYRGSDYDIKLSKVDGSTWSVTLTFKDQSHTLKVF